MLCLSQTGLQLQIHSTCAGTVLISTIASLPTLGYVRAGACMQGLRAKTVLRYRRFTDERVHQ